MSGMIGDVFSAVPSALRPLSANIARYNPLGLRLQIGRSVIALAQLLTLTLTSWNNLEASVLDRPATFFCTGPREASVFCLGSSAPSELGRWIAIGILVLVLTGLAPRVISFLHVWIAISMNVSLALPDGGEGVAAFATGFLAIILIADNRACAWIPGKQKVGDSLRGISYAGAIGLCLQVAGIYYESGLSKIAVSEWADGSAMFYIVRDPYFGAAGLAGQVARWFTDIPFGTALLSWGTILAEVSIATLFLMPWRWKQFGLVLLIALHLGIGIAMGIWSFSLTMIGLGIVAAYTLRPVAELSEGPPNQSDAAT